jgi:hypothetical protein
LKCFDNGIDFSQRFVAKQMCSTHPRRFWILSTARRTSPGLQSPRVRPRIDYCGSELWRREGGEKDGSLAATVLSSNGSSSDPLILSSIQSRRIERVVDALPETPKDLLDGSLMSFDHFCDKKLKILVLEKKSFSPKTATSVLWLVFSRDRWDQEGHSSFAEASFGGSGFDQNSTILF